MAKCITISHSAEGIRMEVSSGSWLMWSNQVQLAESFAHKHAECEELRERLNSAIATLCSVAKIAERKTTDTPEEFIDKLGRIHALASPSIPF